MSLDTFKAKLYKAEAYLRYKTIAKTADRQLPYEALCDELHMLQSARMVRAYSTSGLAPNKLLEVSMDEINKRARLTEILVIAKRSRADLNAITDGIWVYAASTFGAELADHKTKTERDNAVTSCFARGYEILNRIDSLIDQCETIIKDIDQTSFALSRAASLMELCIRRENIANVAV